MELLKVQSIIDIIVNKASIVVPNQDKEKLHSLMSSLYGTKESREKLYEEAIIGFLPQIRTSDKEEKKHSEMYIAIDKSSSKYITTFALMKANDTITTNTGYINVIGATAIFNDNIEPEYYAIQTIRYDKCMFKGQLEEVYRRHIEIKAINKLLIQAMLSKDMSNTQYVLLQAARDIKKQSMDNSIAILNPDMFEESKTYLYNNYNIVEVGILKENIVDMDNSAECEYVGTKRNQSFISTARIHSKLKGYSIKEEFEGGYSFINMGDGSNLAITGIIAK